MASQRYSWPPYGYTRDIGRFWALVIGLRVLDMVEEETEDLYHKGIL